MRNQGGHPGDSLNSQRLRLLDALDRVALFRFKEAVKRERDAFARIILDAYGEWVTAGKPPFPQ